MISIVVQFIALLMISLVVHCIGIKLLMINIVVLCIGIKLLYDKHS